MSDPIGLKISGHLPQPGLQNVENAPQTPKQILDTSLSYEIEILDMGASGKIDAKEGKGDTAPDSGGVTRSRKEAVKEFFSGFFTKISDGLGKLADQFRMRNVEAIDNQKSGAAVADAVHNNDLTAMKKAVKGIAMDMSNVFATNHGNKFTDIDQVVNETFSLKGAEGKAILPKDVAAMKGMLPELRKTFADDPVALKVLDKIEAFDFVSEFQADLDKNLSGLRNIPLEDMKVGLGTFLRANSFFSAAMKADQLQTFDPVSYGKDLIGDHALDLYALALTAEGMQGKGQLPMGKIDNLVPDPLASRIVGTAERMLNDMLKIDGPGGLRERIGEEHLANLRNAANYIAEQDDILPEIRNAAIFNLYNNDLFLRGVVPALTTGDDSRKIPMNTGITVGGLVQAVLNNASGDKMGSDMREAYKSVRDDFQPKLVNAFIALGMPVVPVN